VVVVALLVGAGVAVPRAGDWLVDSEPPAPADVIVVLAGNAPDRLRHALELRRQGYAQVLLVSNERVHTYGLETTWLAIHEAGHSAPELPDADLLVLDDPPPESTGDEASRAAALLAARGAHSALLVTDAFHSRRAALLFRAAFARAGLTIRSTPAPDTFDLDAYWTRPLPARRVVEEYAKLLYWLAQGRLW
jgi:uncharacterized SAM-binding protein YcdF (DUF218 family)